MQILHRNEIGGDRYVCRYSKTRFAPRPRGVVQVLKGDLAILNFEDQGMIVVICTLFGIRPWLSQCSFGRSGFLIFDLKFVHHLQHVRHSGGHCLRAYPFGLRANLAGQRDHAILLRVLNPSF